MLVTVVFPGHVSSRMGMVFACMNFPIDNIFCSFYLYPCKVTSVFVETNSRTGR